MNEDRIRVICAFAGRRHLGNNRDLLQLSVYFYGTNDTRREIKSATQSHLGLLFEGIEQGEHRFDRAYQRNGFRADLKAPRPPQRPCQLIINIDRAAAHARGDPARLADRRPAHPHHDVIVQDPGIVNDVDDFHRESLNLVALDDRLAKALHAGFDLTKPNDSTVGVRRTCSYPKSEHHAESDKNKRSKSHI